MAVLKRELRGDIAAGSYRSKGLEKAVLERDLREDAKGCTHRKRRKVRI